MSRELQVRRFRSLREPPNQESNWEALCPELFALILKAVQQNARRDAHEARRVVALAGVCRRWRYLIQQLYSSPLAETGLVQFPFALRQPGPCSHPVRCLLRRRGSSFVLFQQIHNGSSEKLNFLMAARREWRARGSCFTISASHSNFSKSRHTYMGKLRSNFWGTNFDLWEVTGHPQKNKRLVIGITFSESLREGLRQRTMACKLFTISKQPTSGTNSGRGYQVHPLLMGQQFSASSAGDRHAVVVPYKIPGLHGCFPMSPVHATRQHGLPSKRKAAPMFLRSYSSLRRANYTYLEKSNSKADPIASSMSRWCSREQSVFAMETKVPQWDEVTQCWCLDFHGRASLPSHYNFQLVQSPGTTVIDGSSNSNVPDNETTFLQLGKVGKDLYSVDYCNPLSAFQAFSICLSSFATKVGVDP